MVLLAAVLTEEVVLIIVPARKVPLPARRSLIHSLTLTHSLLDHAWVEESCRDTPSESSLLETYFCWLAPSRRVESIQYLSTVLGPTLLLSSKIENTIVPITLNAHQKHTYGLGNDSK
jgi:hypothetical protein